MEGVETGLGSTFETPLDACCIAKYADGAGGGGRYEVLKDMVESKLQG